LKRALAAASTAFVLLGAPLAAQAGVCTGPFCGSFASAIASGGGGSTDRDDGSATLATQTLGPVHVLRPADPVDPVGEGNISEESAVADIAFGAGVFAIEMGTTSDAHDFGANVMAGAAGRINYDENLTVSSGSLPAGTDVTVRLRYRLAYGATVVDSLDPAVVASYNFQQQYADVQAEATALLDDFQGGGVSNQSLWSTFYGSAPTITGLFADPTQAVELVVPAKVGQTVRFHFYLNGGAGSQATVRGQFAPFEFPTAESAGTVAVVFGLEADEPGVTLASPVLGAVPGFSGVTAAHAYASVPQIDVGPPVTVPEPGALSSLGVAVAILAARRALR
jgi:hypothetical protein